MVDFIAKDINKFEDQMINYIEAYYSLLKTDKEKDDISNIKIGTKAWCEKIINLLYDYKKNDEKKKLNDEGIDKYLNEIKDSKEPKVEFYMVINIVHFLYEIYFNYKRKKKNERSDYIIYKRTRCIHKETIELRNELSHIQNRFPMEDILRLYENFYYLIKFMKPENIKVKLDEQFLKEIKINIHIYLEKNLNYDKSFELNELFEEFKNFEIENKIIDIAPNIPLKLDEKIFKENTENIIKSIFEFPPKKLEKYDFIQKKEEDIKEIINLNKSEFIEDEKEKDEEQKNKNENSFDESSNESISGSFSKYSSNSERSSINEKEGNIKKKDESIVINSEYDIQNDI